MNLISIVAVQKFYIEPGLTFNSTNNAMTYTQVCQYYTDPELCDIELDTCSSITIRLPRVTLVSIVRSVYKGTLVMVYVCVCVVWVCVSFLEDSEIMLIIKVY